MTKETSINDSATVAGRTCPLSYRYSPAEFARPASYECETLYVVGGLYGNVMALESVLRLFERESGPKRLFFNGDFNWFNVEPAAFEKINQVVLAHDAIRGNVETELSVDQVSGADDAGCGCGYPDWVGDNVVEHSNRIIARLRKTAVQFPELMQQLAELPRFNRVDVAGYKVAVVHGDAESLAGWGFAQEYLRDPAHQKTVQKWFEAAKVDAFASTHTCLPIFHSLKLEGRSRPPLILNNGAAGMPNFASTSYGLLTRISVQPFDGPERRFGLTSGDIYIDGIGVEIDSDKWRAAFLRQWPAGTDAHTSYWERIQRGPAYAENSVISQ